MVCEDFVSTKFKSADLPLGLGHGAKRRFHRSLGFYVRRVGWPIRQSNTTVSKPFFFFFFFFQSSWRRKSASPYRMDIYYLKTLYRRWTNTAPIPIYMYITHYGLVVTRRKSHFYPWNQQQLTILFWPHVHSYNIPQNFLFFNHIWLK